MLRVNVFVGGPPAMTVAAVMPLPEGMSELAFAGLLGRRRVPMICRPNKLPIPAEADFCITGYLDPKRLKPEGPFGDHLGYYSLAHDFPVMHVEHVYHREGAIWPFTVVGRPPQEDTIFGQLIHELVGRAIPKTIPGRQGGSCGRCGRRASAAAGHRQRALRALRRAAPAARIAHAGQRAFGPRAVVAGQVSVDRRRRGSTRPGRAQRARFLPPRAGAGRLAARSALPDLHHDRHARLQLRTAERRLEAGDCGGRPGDTDVARGHRQPAVLARGIGIQKGPDISAGHFGGRRAGVPCRGRRARFGRRAVLCALYPT